MKHSKDQVKSGITFDGIKEIPKGLVIGGCVVEGFTGLKSFSGYEAQKLERYKDLEERPTMKGIY